MQQYWISIGHQKREYYTFKRMKKDLRWQRLVNLFGEEEAEIRARTLRTFCGEKFPNSELELE